MEEVIGAFVDDERVDTDALKRALALPEGREYLVELLAMRELVAVPIDRALIEPATRPSPSRRWALAAAAVVLLAVSSSGGYFAGSRIGGRSQVLSPATVTPAAVAPDTAASAPRPTTVIKLEAGVDWTERAGGGN